MKLNRYLLGSTLVAAVGGFLFGFDTVVISGTTEALSSVFNLSPWALGFTVASALIGTVVGSLISGKPAEWFGRKPILMVLAVLYFITAVGCGLAWDWWSLLFFRFIGGLAIGGASVVSPMYIAEISPPHARGRLVAMSQWNIVAGLLVAEMSNYLIGRFLTSMVNGVEVIDPSAWRWMLGIVAIPAVLFLFLLLPIPESPRWLVKCHRREEALSVLEKLGNEDAPALLQDIVDSLHEETVGADEAFFQRKYLRPILLAFMVASFNQLAGINAVLYYSADIFRMAGAERTSALAQSVIIGLTNLIFTMVGMACIDRFGRRVLLIIGGFGLTRLPRYGRLCIPPGRADQLRRPFAVLSVGGGAAGAGQPHRLHRFLRVLPGGSDLGVHRRDLPQSRSRPRAGLGQLHALVLVHADQLHVPGDRGPRLPKRAVRVLRGDDGPGDRVGVGSICPKPRECRSRICSDTWGSSRPGWLATRAKPQAADSLRQDRYAVVRNSALRTVVALITMSYYGCGWPRSALD